jgi:hypothetical protein
MENGKEDRPIKEWMDIFSQIYSQVDYKRTPEQIWIAIMAHSSSIGEAIRRFAFQELLCSAAHTFCWLCSFVNKCNKAKEDDIFLYNESVCGIVSLKYPLKCGHCELDYCQCKAKGIDIQKDKSARYKDLARYRNDILKSVETYNISQWKEKFKGIYGDRIHIQTPESIGFHFLEEVGEGAVAVRKLSQLRGILNEGIEGIDTGFFKKLSTVDGMVKDYSTYYKSEAIDCTSKDPNILKWRIVEAKVNLVIEIGDTFSWFCAILNKLDEISETSGFKLSLLEEKIESEYFDANGNPKCPTCNSKTCTCVFFI